MKKAISILLAIMALLSLTAVGAGAAELALTAVHIEARAYSSIGISTVSVDIRATPSALINDEALQCELIVKNSEGEDVSDTFRKVNGVSRISFITLIRNPLAPGKYTVSAKVSYNGVEKQSEEITFEVVNKQELDRLQRDIYKFIQLRYTKESWAKLLAAHGSAWKIAWQGSYDITQAEIDAAYDELAQAIEGLEPRFTGIIDWVLRTCERLRIRYWEWDI